EGRGRAETARELGVNEGTLSTRLADARKRLRTRLARRGVDVAAALCAIEVASGPAPAALIGTTVTAVVRGAIAPAVAALIRRGVGSMFTTTVQQLTALGLLAAVLTAGTAGLRGFGPALVLPPAAQEDAVPKPPRVPVTVVGRATGPDGQPVK